MKRSHISTRVFAGLGLLMALAAPPVLAEKPAHAGGGKHDKQEKHVKADKADKAQRGSKDKDNRASSRDAAPISIGGYFQDDQRMAVRGYYEPRFRAGNCPPGLAKKNNGCMPPGQAKKWRKGYRLPSDVVYYPVPNAILGQIGVPPSGHKYVRVAADILLIAVGTGMVIDAIEDLSRL